jgi:hypothetical protein
MSAAGYLVREILAVYYLLVISPAFRGNLITLNAIRRKAPNYVPQEGFSDGT